MSCLSFSETYKHSFIAFYYSETDPLGFLRRPGTGSGSYTLEMFRRSCFHNDLNPTGDFFYVEANVLVLQKFIDLSEGFYLVMFGQVLHF